MSNKVIQMADSNSNNVYPIGAVTDENGGYITDVSGIQSDISNIEDTISSRGIGAWSSNDIPRSVSCINLARAYQGGIFRMTGAAGTEGTGYHRDMPSALQNKTYVVYRQQMVFNGGTLNHAIVMLYEVFPTPGRIWMNAYNTSWKGWKSVTLT